MGLNEVTWLIIKIALAIGALVFILYNIRVIPQSYVAIVERLGEYHRTWRAGPHFRIPLVHRIAKYISLKEQVEDFRPQSVITKDNVNIHIDTVVYYQVTDPKLYTYGVDRPLSAIENLTATTLRDIIGTLNLDETLTSRDVINAKMRTTLDEATDVWGIKINRVELKNIIPPRDIQDSMERQMKAERDSREAILRAEGEKKSAVLVAQGRKEAAILTAEAEREASILSAQGKKQTEILLAEGKAEAIVKIQSAQAEGIRRINASNPSAQALALKSMESFEKVANGQATKLVIPTELQGMAGLTSAFKEFLGSPAIPTAEDANAKDKGDGKTPLIGSSKVTKKLEDAKGLGKLEGRFGITTGGSKSGKKSANGGVDVSGE